MNLLQMNSYITNNSSRMECKAELAKLAGVPEVPNNSSRMECKGECKSNISHADKLIIVPEWNVKNTRRTIYRMSTI